MAFALSDIRRELQAATAQPPVPPDLAIAVINDVFRLAGRKPATDPTWEAWMHMRRGLWPEQVAMLAHCLMYSSLRTQSVKTLAAGAATGADVLDEFFKQVEPLTAEMVRGNAFREEEFLRKWISVVGGSIEGESAEESRRRVESLDYRKTLDEYRRAEQARAQERAKRLEAERIAREAAEREAAARGWRE
ncbi:MAG: hypothetical protein HUU03_09425 [Planctomycetaceae bacterium]|nr:hypothetical protein [Planctomycetaceae bacterium]